MSSEFSKVSTICRVKLVSSWIALETCFSPFTEECKSAISSSMSYVPASMFISSWSWLCDELPNKGCLELRPDLYRTPFGQTYTRPASASSIIIINYFVTCSPAGIPSRRWMTGWHRVTPGTVSTEQTRQTTDKSTKHIHRYTNLYILSNAILVMKMRPFNQTNCGWQLMSNRSRSQRRFALSLDWADQIDYYYYYIEKYPYRGQMARIWAICNPCIGPGPIYWWTIYGPQFKL